MNSNNPNNNIIKKDMINNNVNNNTNNNMNKNI